MGRLLVNKKSWHFRLYSWAVDFWLDFTDRRFYIDRSEWRQIRVDRSKQLKKASNLCFYMRVILVWAPLVILLHLSTLAVGWYVFIITPAKLFGLGTFWLTIFIGLLIVGAIVGIAWLLSRAVPTVDRGLKFIADKIYDKFEPAGTYTASFFKLLWKFVVTNKKKICPTINIINGEEG